MQLPLVCPYCWDQHVEPMSDARLYGVNSSHGQPLAASVFRCRQWHIFATFPTDGPTLSDGKTER
jgi:hypothetical protein